MKTKIISIVLAAITVLCLTACQATPEQDVVIGKDSDRMVEKAQDDTQGLKLADLNIPESNYTFSDTSVDGKLTVDADTPIVVPSSGKLPMAAISAGVFSQEMVTGIFNYLYPNEKPLNSDPNSVATKASIEENILSLKKQLADQSYDTQEFTESDIEARIAALEEAYQTAPETAQEATISNGTMLLTDRRGSSAYTLDVYDDDSSLTIVSQENSGDSFLMYRKNGIDYNTSSAIPANHSSISESVSNKLTLSYDEAKKLCDELFISGGLSNMVLADAFIIDDSQDGNTDNKVSNAENYAYLFCYTRTVNGTPIALNYQEESSNDDSFSVPWAYESIQIIVDNNGILGITWLSPVSIGENITEDASLISYESAMDIFEKMIITKYEQSVPEGETLNLVVNDIQLCLIRVRVQNSNGLKGVLTPVWMFYGKSNGGSAKSTLLAVNAVDGSIIDTALGY